MPIRTRIPTLLASIVALILPAVVSANVGPPMTGGRLASEPVGIEGIDILGEVLTIDMRDPDDVRVVAIYQLDNGGPEKRLELVFASGSPKVLQFEVTLDADTIESVPKPELPIPDAWKAPLHTPTLEGGPELAYLRYDSKGASPIGFTVAVPPGKHTLRVRYASEMARHHDGKPTDYRQFAYVLAPARSWASFGGLEVSIRVPDGWRAAVAPAMERDVDTFRGKFSEVPADAIAITMQRPAGTVYHVLSRLRLVLWLVALVGGLAWSVMLGVRTARRGGNRWVAALLAGFGWGAIILAAGFVSIFGPVAMIPSSEVNNYGYEQIFSILGTVLLAMIAVPIGFCAALVGGMAGRPTGK